MEGVMSVGINLRTTQSVAFSEIGKADQGTEKQQPGGGGITLKPSTWFAYNMPPRLDGEIPQNKTMGNARLHPPGIPAPPTPVLQVAQNQGKQVSKPLPDFPTGNVTDEAKLAFTIQLLKDFPRVTRAALEETYTYTDPRNPKVKSGPLQFAGGGQGNVIFIKGTPFVVKKNLPAPEANTYKFLVGLRQFFDRQPMSLNNLPLALQQCTQQELTTMYNNRDAIRATFPVSISLYENRDSLIVAMKNVTWGPNGQIDGASIEDLKLGARIVSRGELKAHNNKEGKGLLNWFVKKLSTRYLPKFKGTKSRGFEYIPQSSSVLKRICDGINSSKIMKGKCNAMTRTQLESFVNQLAMVKLAHACMPITFVGSSAMIALPSPGDRDSMPNVCMGDFAHAMTLMEARDTQSNLTMHTYTKYDRNFHDGIDALYQLAAEALAATAS